MERVLNEDEKDARFSVLYRDDNRTIWAKIADEELTVYDSGSKDKFHLINIDFERALSVSAMQVGPELGATNEDELAQVLITEFGTVDGYDRLCDFLKECGFDYKDKRMLYNGPDDNPKGSDYLSYVEIGGGKMSLSVYHRRMFGSGIDEDEIEIEPVSVGKLKKALGVESDIDLWQKVYNKFGVWDGHKRLEEYSDNIKRTEYQERFWDVSDEEWKELKDRGLVPDRNSEKCWAKFDELMQTPVKEKGMTFDDDTILFMGKMDLVGFGKKFPGEADWYMIMSE